jgi:O-acetyl-ADP-ribose deacetylase (regulator of RNase III)
LAIAEYYKASTGKASSNEITTALQDYLNRIVCGYNPPANALTVDMDKILHNTGTGLPYLIHVPTMAMPSIIPHPSSLVFNCMWNILCAVKLNNAHPERRPIHRVLVPGLGTGHGKVPYKSCCSQILAAVNLFALYSLNTRPITYEQADEFNDAIVNSMS